MSFSFGGFMKLVIDADGCPVVALAVKTAEKYGVRCMLVCDTAHTFSNILAEIITVSQGADSADFRIVNLLEKGDIVVTQDYGLAAMCLAKNATAINQNGLIYSEKNMDELLLSRHIHKKVRRAGGRMKGPKKRTKQQDEAFEQTLTALFEERIRNNKL